MPESSDEEQPSKNKRRMVTFSDSWTNIPEYSDWLQKIDEQTARCTYCVVSFSIKYEGLSALRKHFQSKKHQTIKSAKQIAGSLSKFTTKSQTPARNLAARAEVASVFHNVIHGLSYNSLDCHLKVSRNIFCDSKIAGDMSCGRTKAAAIARNVLAPYAQQQIVIAMQKNVYFSIGNDASSIGNKKLYALTVQYFDSNSGICKKLLDFYEDFDGKSIAIFENIKRIIESNGLEIQKISSFSADNAAVNYGINNSVYQKLSGLNKQILKANCNCHVINNCVKFAINALSVDIENIVIKIFNEFSSSALASEKLKQCFEFANLQYKALLRHVPTRWLSLFPAIERLILNWPAVKRYFLLKGKKATRKELWDFVSKNLPESEVISENEECFQEGLSEAYLYFLHNMLPDFQTSVLALESDSSTIVDVDHIMRKLLNTLQSKLKDKYFGSKTKSILAKLPQNERNIFKEEAENFLKAAIDYLTTHYDFSDNSIKKYLSLLSLKENLISWDEVEMVIAALNLKNELHIDVLYTDYCSLRSVYDAIPKNVPNDQIWASFFRSVKDEEMKNLKKFIAFIYSIPLSNAFCEKVFSILNDLYSKDRNKMAIDLIKAELVIRLNIDENCKTFIEFLNREDSTKLLEAAQNNTKYLWN
ncbi:uncharacterized protein LOC118749947 [Rhagoletis pomonella]|uniref:uncharacterized protein LOC118744004 n=1 Tax=Rhagoletis pomonella TaxID=28610 RepID=UPI0017873AA1|nr:uncharacterized protein LOC118744004 [Rhagoletis pomonella]XP_036340596.1 uncharacterized protein LOC118749947 [Rhagoletis pomonella]